MLPYVCTDSIIFSYTKVFVLGYDPVVLSPKNRRWGGGKGG